MASTQSQAVTDLYRDWQQTLFAHPEWTPAQTKDFIENWVVLTAAAMDAQEHPGPRRTHTASSSPASPRPPARGR